MHSIRSLPAVSRCPPPFAPSSRAPPKASPFPPTTILHSTITANNRLFLFLPKFYKCYSVTRAPSTPYRSLCLTAATQVSEIITTLHSHPLENTPLESSIAVKYTVYFRSAPSVKVWSLSKEARRAVLTAGSEVVRVSRSLDGVLEGVEAAGRLASYSAMDELGVFAGDGSVDVKFVMEVWTSLEEAPNARRVQVHLQRVPPNIDGDGFTGSSVRSGGYSAEELSRRRKLVGKSRARIPNESPVPTWAPDTVTVMHLLETDRLRIVSQLIAKDLGEDLVPWAAEKWTRFAFGQVGPFGLVRSPGSLAYHNHDDDTLEGPIDGSKLGPLFLEGVDWSLEELRADDADESVKREESIEPAEATMILWDRGTSRDFASAQVSATIDASLPSSNVKDTSLVPPLCDKVSASNPGTHVGTIPLIPPEKKRNTKKSNVDSGNDDGCGGSSDLNICIHMCQSESGGVSFIAYSTPLSVFDLFLRVTLLHRWDQRHNLIVQGSVTVPPSDDSWSAPIVMQVMQSELKLEAGFVRPGGGGTQDNVERGNAAMGALRLQVQAAILRPRRVALRLPFEAWSNYVNHRTEQQQTTAGGGKAGKHKGRQKGKMKTGSSDKFTGPQPHLHFRSSSPAGHHWIEVQPWENIHESLTHHASALASVAAGQEVAPSDLLMINGGILLPGPIWSNTTTSMYSALLHGANDFSLEATSNSSAIWRWEVDDRATVHVLPRPTVSDWRLSHQCAATMSALRKPEAAAEGEIVDHSAPITAAQVDELAPEERLKCEMHDLIWYLHMYKVHGRGDKQYSDSDGDLSWDGMLSLINNDIVGSSGNSQALRDQRFLAHSGNLGVNDWLELDAGFSHFGSDISGLSFGTEVLPSSSETATELLLIATAGVYVTMTGWYCAGAMRRLKGSGHGRGGVALHHRRMMAGGGGLKGIQCRSGGMGSSTPGGIRGIGSGGLGAVGWSGSGGVSVGVQVAIAAVLAPFQAAWFLIGIPCDALAYLACCAAAAIEVMLRCATLVMGRKAGPDEPDGVAAAINCIRDGAGNKNHNSVTLVNTNASSKKSNSKGGSAKGASSKSMSSSGVSGGMKHTKASTAAVVATPAAAPAKDEDKGRAIVQATVSEEEFLAQQALEEAELEAQRRHAEARMQERRQAELQKKAAGTAAISSRHTTSKTTMTTKAKTPSPATEVAQQPAGFSPRTFNSIPQPLQGCGPAPRNNRAAAASVTCSTQLSGHVPVATTTTGVALPKPRPLPAALTDSLRRRITPIPPPRAQQQHPPPSLPLLRLPLPQLQPLLPQQLPPLRQPKANDGSIPPLPPQPPPANQPKRDSQPSSSSWGPLPPHRHHQSLPSSLMSNAGADSFDGLPVSPAGSSQSATRSETDFLGGDHSSIPWSDAGAEMQEQETLVARMLEGLGDDDLETSTTILSSTKIQAPLSASHPPAGVTTAAAFGGGMWGGWGATKSEPRSPTESVTRSTLW